MLKKQGNATARRMVPLRFVLIPIAIILSAFVFLILMAIIAPKPSKNPVELKPPLVEIQALTTQAVTFEISSQGTVVPRTRTELVSEVSGQIIKVSPKFKVGGFFKEGEEILAVDDINYQVALVQAESRLGIAQANLIEEKARGQQAKEEWLLSNKPLSQAPVMALRTPQLQKAEAELKAAQADLQQAKVKLSRTKIRAPYDAMLEAKKVDIGQFVSTGSALATTFAIDYAEVRLPVKQREIEFLDLPKIDAINEFGSKVDLTVNIGENSPHWSAELSRYEGVVDSQSRVHYVVAQVNDPYALLKDKVDSELRIGTFVKAKVSGKTIENVTVIPRSALFGADRIYLLDQENRLSIESIEVLYTDDENVYSQTQLDSAKKLITTKIAIPIQGMKLRLSQAKSNSSGVE